MRVPHHPHPAPERLPTCRPVEAMLVRQRWAASRPADAHRYRTFRATQAVEAWLQTAGQGANVPASLLTIVPRPGVDRLDVWIADGVRLGPPCGWNHPAAGAHMVADPANTVNRRAGHHRIARQVRSAFASAGLAIIARPRRRDADL